MNNTSIGRRLGIGFSILLALSLLSTLFALWKLSTVADAARVMMQEPLAKERLISDWYRNIHSGVRRASAIAKSSDPSLNEFFAAEQAASSKSSNELRDKIEDLLREDEEKVLYAAIGTARKSYVDSRDEMTKAKQAGLTDEANRILKAHFLPQSVTYIDKVQALLDHQRETIDATARHIDEIGDQSRQLLVLLGVLSLMAGAGLSWVLTRSITTPIHRALALTRKVAAGDLNIRVTDAHRDETGQLLSALGQMAESLTGMIHTIRQSSESIKTATTEIAAGNQDLAHRTESASASLQQTTSSMAQLEETVLHNGQSATAANKLAASAARLAAEGGEVVNGVVASMAEISHSSQRIQDIISVIDGIAFQTNILALNAAVEAARAGEQGRGFAVVASEVRALAQRSAQAAKEIKTLIQSSGEKVQYGSGLVGTAGEKMQDIVEAIRQVSSIVENIASAATTQGQGIREVNTSVRLVDNATQQNAALVEESTAAAESLKEQAMRLNGAVAVFQIA